MLLDFLITFGCNGNNHGAACSGLLDIGDHLVVNRGICCHGDDRVAFRQKRDGAVLHLSGGIRLSVEVVDLLEFEGALVADGSSHASANEQGVIGVLAGLRCGLEQC